MMVIVFYTASPKLACKLFTSTALTLKRYKFNWSNPTAAWNLNLEEKTQRSIMMQIIAINNFESEFSKNASGRGDTSQQVSLCHVVLVFQKIEVIYSALCLFRIYVISLTFFYFNFLG